MTTTQSYSIQMAVASSSEQSWNKCISHSCHQALCRCNMAYKSQSALCQHLENPLYQQGKANKIYLKQDKKVFRGEQYYFDLLGVTACIQWTEPPFSVQALNAALLFGIQVSVINPGQSFYPCYRHRLACVELLFLSISKRYKPGNGGGWGK